MGVRLYRICCLCALLCLGGVFCSPVFSIGSELTINSITRLVEGDISKINIYDCSSEDLPSIFIPTVQTIPGVISVSVRGHAYPFFDPYYFDVTKRKFGFLKTHLTYIVRWGNQGTIVELYSKYTSTK